MNLSGRWVTSGDAATLLGIRTATLRSRRQREGAQHPSHLRNGSVVLYDEIAIRRYATEWVDGRRR